ncbi:MAG: putative Fe-S cluster assembly protein SufT [Verrucomicrobiales bacterium]
MQTHQEIELLREVEAIQIPSGDLVTLPLGTKVMITQSLGGTYTVATPNGLARIKSENIDALGIDPEAEAEKKEAIKTAAADGDIEGAVWEQLKMVFDPEIPVNIVDLGLVYDCQIAEEEGETNVEIKMTLTAPGCGMGPTIAADAQSKILMIDEVANARVDLVWDPAWNQDMISEEGKMKLGMV